MRQAGAAARHLEAFGGSMNGDAERALWTGLIVTYARPFLASNEVGPVGGHLARFDTREFSQLHTRLCDLRHVVAAHNTRSEVRGAEDAWSELGIGVGGYAESWQPFDERALPIIAELAELLEQRFRERRDEVEVELGRHRASE